MESQNFYSGKLIIAADINEEESSIEIMQLNCGSSYNNAGNKRGNWSNTFQPKALLINPDKDNVCDRDCDSPFKEPIIITVPAVVHHSLDWSPSADNQSGSFRSAVLTKNQQNEKQSEKNNDDSGFDGEEMDSSSSNTDSNLKTRISGQN